MTWVKLDDQFFRNPKIRAVGKDGRELYIAGLCHCAAGLTDGRIEKSMLAVIAAEAEVKPSTAKRLVEAELWGDDGTAYVVHDYLAWNPSGEAVRARRAQRKEAGKRGGEQSGKSRRSKTEANDEANASAKPEAEPNPGPVPVPTEVVPPPRESAHCDAPALSQGRIADIAEQYQWPEAFVQHEYDKFCEHSDAHGRTFANIDKGFLLWLSRARPPAVA